MSVSVSGSWGRTRKAAGIVSVLVLSLALAGCGGGTSAPEPAAEPQPAFDVAALIVTDGTVTADVEVSELMELDPVVAVFENDKGRFEGMGASLAKVLEAAGFDLADVVSVEAVAEDGFTAAYEAADIALPDTIVAYASADGEPLDEADGPYRVVMPDGNGKQNPRNIVQLNVNP